MKKGKKIYEGKAKIIFATNDKNTVIALREIGLGKVDTTELRKNAVLRLRKEPNESAQEEIQEEVSNDDFEKQYKGEVSKSGVAILPSKRMRKIPIQTTSDNEDKKVEKTTEESESPLKLTEEVEVKEEKK